MDQDYMTELVSVQLKKIRSERGYTQEKMADVIGLSKSRWCRLRKGGRLRNGRMLWRFARFSDQVKHCNPY
ncbi:helix-turn-helix transcriptional regulator [Bacillus velezensis]|nr:helix-turn-helix transcriptional regulator [Bacillus velezensis]